MWIQLCCLLCPPTPAHKLENLTQMGTGRSGASAYLPETHPSWFRAENVDAREHPVKPPPPHAPEHPVTLPPPRALEHPATLAPARAPEHPVTLPPPRAPEHPVPLSPPRAPEHPIIAPPVA
mmetsp:Transcript_19139/g.26317  ORF Transcript_19139/g.26317 Transcript_19139/m.26317 type:complete len:122 (-) Transcript_19139:171-536(-)